MQPVHRPDAIALQVPAPSHEHAQLDDHLVRYADRGQVTTHPGLVGDDRGVFRVGLARTPVTAGRPIDLVPGQVTDLLVVSGQQRQQQRGFSGADINSPADLPG